MGKSLLRRVQLIRELLDRRVIQYIVRLDARDASADGLIKEAVPRTLLHQLTDGDVCFNYECATWTCKAPRSDSRQQQHLHINEQQQQRKFLSVMMLMLMNAIFMPS